MPADRGISRVPFVWNWNYGNELWQPRDFDALVRAYRSWVYVASNKNAQTVAQLPLRLYGVKESSSEKFLFRSKKISAKTYKQIETSGHIQGMQSVRKAVEIEELTEHPFIDLLNNVNPFTNQFDLIELTDLFQELTGNSYWYPVRNNLGAPAQIWQLPPQRVTIIPDRENFIAGYMYRIGSYEVRLEENEVIHFKFPNPADMYYGISPLSASATAYNINENMNRYESAMFKNNGRLEGAFETENELDEESFKRLKEELKENFAGVERSGTMPLLERGVKFKPYSLPPKEMAFLQGRKWTKEEILNAYGQSLGMYDENATRANSETADYTYKRDTVRPRAIRMEQKINEKFMPLYDENIFVMFDSPVPEDREFALRERETNLRSYYSSINLERAKVGEEPVPWGNTPLVPFSVVQLSAGRASGGQGEVEEGADIEIGKRVGGPEKINKMPAVEGDIRTKIWKQFAAGQDLHEGRVKKELKKLFDEQRKEVLRNLKKLAQHMAEKTIVNVFKKESVESLLFARDKWNKEFAKRVNDMIAATADDGVDFGIAQIAGAAEFEIGRQQVEDFLKRYKVRLSKTLWPDVNKETLAELRATMVEGVAENEGITALRERIDTIFDNAVQYRSERIARTETVRAYNTGTVESWKMSEVVKGKSWLAERDNRICDWCDAMDGETVGLEENYFDKGAEIEGESGAVMVADYGDIPNPPLHPNCFVDHNIPIYTSRGWVPIIDIAVGNLVLTHRKRFRKVTQLIRSTQRNAEIVKIFVRSGDGARKWPLTITANHPILANGKWIDAGNIIAGDKIAFLAGTDLYKKFTNDQYDFTEMIVAKVEKRTANRVKRLYNFSVEEDESYIAKGFVSHNCRCALIAQL